MGAEDDLVGPGHGGHHFREHLGVRAGNRVPDGVRQVDRSGAGLDGRLHNFTQERPFATGGVLAGELHVIGEAPHRRWPRPPWPAPHGRHAEHEPHVDGAGAGERVNSPPRGGLQCLRRRVDVLLDRAGQRGDDRPAHLLADPPDRLELHGRTDGEPRLDHVHAQTNQLMRDLHLLIHVQRGAGTLLGVAQRGIEYRHVIHGFFFVRHTFFSLSGSRIGKVPHLAAPASISGRCHAGHACDEGECSQDGSPSKRFGVCGRCKKACAAAYTRARMAGTADKKAPPAPCGAAKAACEPVKTVGIISRLYDRTGGLSTTFGKKIGPAKEFSTG